MRCEFAFADVDECIVTPEVCGTGGTCVNTVGSYVCTCTSGYIWSSDDGTCVSKLCNVHTHLNLHDSPMVAVLLQHTLQHAGLNAHTNGCSIAIYNTHLNMQDSMHTPMVA